MSLSSLLQLWMENDAKGIRPYPRHGCNITIDQAAEVHGTIWVWFRADLEYVKSCVRHLDLVVLVSPPLPPRMACNA